MANPAWTSDFEALARQYWAGWNEMMRQAAGAAAPASPFAMGQGFTMPGFGAPTFGAPGMAGVMPGMGGWQDALAQWNRFAQTAMGTRQPDFADTLNDTLGRFQQQAGDWFGRMQQLAGELAGQTVGAADVAERWKQMLEQSGEGAWLEMFRTMQSPQAHGFDEWYDMVQPMLSQWRGEARSWLSMPTFGVAREHQERLQQLLQAQIDYQDTLAAHNALLSRSMDAAYRNFERRLAQHEAPGTEITSARALFDLWIDAAEEAFADMALSTDYRHAYGAMVNAQMRLRQDVQQQIEQATGMLGMPTRTEIEAAHRKIAELERIVRRMMRGEATTPPGSRRASAEEAAPVRHAPARKVARKAGAKAPTRQVARKAAKKTAKKVTKKAAPKRRVAKKTARSTPRGGRR